MIKVAISIWLISGCYISCGAAADYFSKNDTNLDIGQYYEGIIGMYVHDIVFVLLFLIYLKF